MAHIWKSEKERKEFFAKQFLSRKGYLRGVGEMQSFKRFEDTEWHKSGHFKVSGSEFRLENNHNAFLRVYLEVQSDKDIEPIFALYLNGKQLVRFAPKWFKGFNDFTGYAIGEVIQHRFNTGDVIEWYCNHPVSALQVAYIEVDTPELVPPLPFDEIVDNG